MKHIEKFRAICHTKNIKLIEEFISQNKISNTCFSEGLSVAAMCGYTDVLKVLLTYKEAREELNNILWLCIEFAAMEDYIEIVEELLKYKEIPWNSKYIWEEIALTTALKKKHYKIVKLLLDDGRVDPSYDNNIALILASDYGKTEIVEKILQDKRVNSTIDKNFALTLAKDYGYQEIADLLVESL